MSEDARVTRLMRRCAREGLAVPREAAERALREEEGLVGRAMVGLRIAWAKGPLA